MLVNALRAHLAEFGVVAPHEQASVGKFEVPNWDPTSQAMVRSQTESTADRPVHLGEMTCQRTRGERAVSWIEAFSRYWQASRVDGFAIRCAMGSRHFCESRYVTSLRC
jgi:hypothetical protein